MNRAKVSFFRSKSNGAMASDHLDEWCLRPSFRRRSRLFRAAIIMIITTHASIVLQKRTGGIAEASDSFARTKARTAARVPAMPEASQDGKPKEQVAPAPRGIGIENVLAEGWGDNEEQALRDAFRNAIRQVLGAIVNAKTVVENDRLVLDRIVTFSDGFIEHYDILETSSKDGRVCRRIMASVRKRDLTMHLRAERDSASYDGRGLWPEAITKIEHRRSASELLKASLEDYPWICLDVAMKGLPKVLRTLDTAAYLEPTILLRLDINKFNDHKQTLCVALDALCVASGTITSRLEKLDGAPRAAVASQFEKHFFGKESSRPLAKQKIEFGQIFEMPCKQSELPKSIAELDDKGGKLFIVGDGRKWTWYLVQEKIDLLPKLKTACIKFRDKQDRVIAERAVGLGPIIPGLSVHGTQIDGKELSTVFFSPFFLHHEGSGYGVTMLVGSPGLTLHGEIGISVTDLEKIDHVNVELE